MDLRSEIKKIRNSIASLEDTIAAHEITIQAQDIIIKDQEKQIKRLQSDNVKLKEKLNKKNSNNSSIPPSQDPNRKKRTKSLRTSSGKKSGGQAGHEGNTLKFKVAADICKAHIPSNCERCGKSLTADSIYKGRRQVIDIPPIIPVTTEHQIYSRKCSCGHCTLAAYPNNVKAPVSYGPNIEKLIAYLSIRQYIPINRIREFFREVMNLKIGEGTICNKLNSFAQKCAPYYHQIQQELMNCSWIGSDETGCIVNGEKKWMWTWQSEYLTFIKVSSNRGKQTIMESFPNGFPNSTLVHDCWRSHCYTPAKSHQLCLPHLIRELNYLIELGKERWSKKFKEVLLKACRQKEEILKFPKINHKAKIEEIETQVAELLNKSLSKNKTEKSFKKRMIKYQPYLLEFLRKIEVPPDNNSSERAIRNVKVKQKISGQFKTASGANQFAIIRSVIDTCIKRKVNFFQQLTKISEVAPE